MNKFQLCYAHKLHISLEDMEQDVIFIMFVIG